MKKLVMLCAAAVVTAAWAESVATTGVPASAYVQSGLVAQWDGIENAGAGLHDGAATSWKDLKGDGSLDLTLNATGKFNDNALVADGKNCAAQGAQPSNVDSIDFCYTLDNHLVANSCLYHTGANNGGSCQQVVGMLSSNRGFLFGSGPAGKMYAVGSDYSGLHTVDWNVSSPRCIYDGTNTVVGSGSNNFASSPARLPGVATVGGFGGTDSPAAVKAHSIRLYSRALTTDEIAINANLDRVRFQSADPSTLDWPASFDYTTVESRMLVRSTGSVQVSLDGETWSNEIDKSAKLGETLTVHARSQSGWKIRWSNLLADAVISADGKSVTFKAISKAPVPSEIIPASAYIQDGMMNEWDGLENAGREQYDASSTVWKDLVGDLDLTLAARGSWSEDGKSLTVNGGCAAKGTGATAAYQTIEVVYKMTSAAGRCLFASGCTTGGNRRWVIWDHVTGYSELYADGADTTPYARVSVETSAIKSFAALYSGNIVSAVATNGLVISSPPTQKNTWGIGDGVVMIGERSDNSTTYGWAGEVYTIRLYNRALTANELFLNAAFDRMRFMGETTNDTGCAYSAEGNRVRTTVCVGEAGSGTATILAGEPPIDAGTTNWPVIGTSVTCRAIPSDGRIFSHWSGDTDGLAGGQLTSTTLTLTADVPRNLIAVFHVPSVRRWRGKSSALASVAANWVDEQGATVTTAPMGGDAVVLDDEDAGNLTWDLDNVTLASWNQNGFTGTVTFLTGQTGTGYGTVRGMPQDDGTKALVVTGDVSLATGIWTHQSQPSGLGYGTTTASKSGRGVYRLIAKVGGAFSLGAGAKIDVNLKGFSAAGPYSPSYAFGHGGQGGGYWGPTGENLPYGSIKRPQTLGAGTGNAGGGNVELHVAGAATVNGTVTARGYNGVTTNPNGAGGAIWLTAKSLAGAGALDARAGKSGGGGYGGGGRLAVHLTGVGEDFTGYTGTMDAGTESTTLGYPGTVYLQTAADNGKGELIIRGCKSTADNAWGSVRNGGTPITMPEDQDDPDLRHVSMIDHVQARVDAGLTVRVGSFSSQGSRDYQWINLRGGTLEMTGDWMPTNCWLRVLEPNSVIRLGANGDHTLFMTNNTYAYWDRDFRLEGNLHVRKGGSVRHTLNGTADNNYRLNPHVTGWVTVDAGGEITTKDRGFSKAYGKGAPTVVGYTARGGTYGGRAYDNGGIVCYGSIRCPTDLGSGSANNASGGAMKLVVDGVITNNGTITSQGTTGTTGSSGGSVWIVATNIVGTGTISAAGGNGNDQKWASASYGGGGGRISLKLTDPDASFADFEGTVTANGGYNKEYRNVPKKTLVECASAGAGTLYRETAAQTAGQGSLEIAQWKSYACEILPTEITPVMTETDVGDVTVTNLAWLCVNKDATLTVRGDFVNYVQPDKDLGEISDGTLAAGTVAFADPTRVSHVYGTNRFSRLAVTDPGKTVRFGAADDTLTSVIPGGVFSAVGSETAAVELRGLADGTAWPLAVDPTASTEVKYAKVKDSDASAGMKIIADDTNEDLGDNENWKFMRILPGEEIKWTGAKSAAWGDPDNWDRERAPVDTDVILVGKTDNPPVLSAPMVCNRLTIAAEASLDLAGFDLTVTNDFSCAGTLTAGGAAVIRFKGNVSLTGGAFAKSTSTVILDGTSKQSVDFAGQDLYVVTVLNDVDFTAGFSADFFTCETDCARALRFAAGEQVTTKTLTLQGVVGETPMLTLASLTSGSAWKVSYSAKASVRGVVLSDSTAVGHEIAAEIPSTDGTGNTNWRFGVSSAVWTGGASGNWNDPSKWSGGVVPDTTARVVFENAASVTMPAEIVTVRAVEISGATVTLTGIGAEQGLTALEYFEVLDGGIVCLDTRLTVNGDAYIRSGGTVTHTANGSGAKSTDRGYGIYMTVLNDMLVEADGKLDAKGRGFSGGCGPGNEGDYAAYGGRGTPTAKVAYGSIFNPAELGSGGDGSAGGGRVKLSVGKTLTVNGTIDADGAYVSNRAGSGGSVNITCGTLAGSGFVYARGGNYSQNVSPGCGGRVALYQTTANDLTAWSGTLAAWGGLYYTPTGLPQRMPGSVYLQMADETDYAGTIVVNNNGGSTDTGGVDLPVTNQCPDSVKSYRTAKVSLTGNGTLYITQDVTIDDLELTAGSRVNLNGHVLSIMSRTHKHGKGWPSNWKKSIVYPGTDAAGNPGKIVWPQGFSIIVK